MHATMDDQHIAAPFTLGLGCERGASCDEVIALAERALIAVEARLADLVCIASIEARRGEPAMEAAARHFAVPLQLFDAATLEAETPRLHHPSDIVFAHTGCHGVAEASALAASGTGSVLLLPKIKSVHATAAIARAADAGSPIGNERS